MYNHYHIDWNCGPGDTGICTKEERCVRNHCMVWCCEYYEGVKRIMAVGEKIQFEEAQKKVKEKRKT